MKKDKNILGTPVLLIFFARPDTFEKVFETVRKAKPSMLFLACDGPRKGKNDLVNINKCQKIAENIDWECTVYKNYQDMNMGCGIHPMSAIDWAFQKVDRLIILEDDCIPHDSFWSYMVEMLDRYESDERVGLISGFNHFQNYNCGGYSYCFTKTGATLGWGTWKRVWNKYDYNITDFDSDYYRCILEKEVINKKARQHRMKMWMFTRNKLLDGENISWWDHQFGFVKYIESYLVVVPKVNLIYNIGVGIGSSHAKHLTERKWEIGEVCFMPTTPMEFPIIHQKYVICDRLYDDKYFELIAYSPIWRRMINKVQRMWRRLNAR